jgi:hypothetical protein
LTGFLDRIVSYPAGAFLILAFAAFLEALWDSFFQASFYRSAGVWRVVWFLAGVGVLASYGSVVNIPRWDFGKLLGVYVVLFFIMAQILNKLRFQQAPTTPTYVGGSLIVAGGLIIAFWRV